MTNQPFEYQTRLDMCSVDFTGHWQPGAVFRAMQEAADGHCRLLHLTFEELRELGLAWVLTRGHLRMSRYPVLGQTVTVRTWPGETRHMFFPRNFMFEADGEVLGCASMLFVLLDLETRKIALPSRLTASLPVYDIPAPLPLPGNLHMPDAPATAHAYTPVYMDLDMNGHVNNTRYIDWFMNQFSVERHERQMVTDLLAHYNFEVRAGEPITLSLCDKDGMSELRGLNGDTACFGIQGTWANRQ